MGDRGGIRRSTRLAVKKVEGHTYRLVSAGISWYRQAYWDLCVSSCGVIRFGVAVFGALFLAGLSLSSRAPLGVVFVSVRRNLLLLSEATSISDVVAGD